MPHIKYFAGMLKNKDKLESKFTDLKLKTTASPLSKKIIKYPNLKKSVSATEQSTVKDVFHYTNLVKSSSVVASVLTRNPCSKRVSFADVIGKNLAEVRHVLSSHTRCNALCIKGTVVFFVIMNLK